MSMTSNLDEIKKITGFLPGSVFVRKSEDSPEKVDTYLGDEYRIKCYDDKTSNFHIFPRKVELREEIAKSYAEKREELGKAFESYFKNESNAKIKFERLPNPANEVNTASKIKKLTNFDNRTLYLVWKLGSASGFYRHLTFYYEDAWYRLNFMRIYHDVTSIHCIFNDLQYDKVTSEKGIGLNFVEKKFAVCYPGSCRNGDIGKNPAGNVVLNPKDADFYGDTDEIVESFIRFITNINCSYSD